MLPDAAGRASIMVIRLKVDDHALLDAIAKRFAEQGRPDDNPESLQDPAWPPITPRRRRCCPTTRARAELVEVDGMASVETCRGRHRPSPGRPLRRLSNNLSNAPLETVMDQESAVDGDADRSL